MFQFTVNGRTVTATEDENLLEYLRETLRLTSLKNGCGEGACGACMILINRPVSGFFSFESTPFDVC